MTTASPSAYGHTLGGRVYTAVVSRPIDPRGVVEAVADLSAGATSVFIGTVRNSHDGRAVEGIEYHAYPAMAIRELQAIAEETARRYGTCGVAVEHRVGHLALGDTSVVIAASHARRAAAFEATRHVIDEIKRRVPIWKREHYTDGTHEWVDPTRADASRALADSAAARADAAGADGELG